jgi:hypothetical protein
MLATMPISRINSWESWFIFNLQKNKQVSRAPSTYTPHSFDLQYYSNIMIYHIKFIHTRAAIFCSTSQMGPSQLRSGERLTPLPRGGYVSPLVRLALVSIINKLFVLTVHASHIQPPFYNYYTSLNTSMHVNIMGLRYDIQIHPHTQTTIFLLVLLLDLQAGQLALYSHVGNSTYSSEIC